MFAERIHLATGSLIRILFDERSDVLGFSFVQLAFISLPISTRHICFKINRFTDTPNYLEALSELELA